MVKHLIKILVVLVSCSASLIAMEGNQWEVIPREEWGYLVDGELHLHTKYGAGKLPWRIIIGHTVTKSQTSHKTVLSIQTAHMGKPQKFATTGYHFLQCGDGKCFECRPPEIVPSIVKGKNAGSCMIGVEGCFETDGIADVNAEFSESMFEHLANAIAYAAYKSEIKELNRSGDPSTWNLLGQSEVAEKYPVSPGKPIMDQMDQLLIRANKILKEKY